jgi:hypothetical protein
LNDASSSTKTTTPQFFTSDERLQLSTIPYPLIPNTLLHGKKNQQFLWCGLLDLLVPYVYDHVTTMGDPTVESAWTITILSNSLSWLDPPTTVKDTVVSLTRRMLLYPYWRNWEFSVQVVWKQTIHLLKQGVHAVIKALLQVRSTLEKSECYYVGNKLFVDPYLYFVQHQPYDGALELVECLSEELLLHSKIKESVGLDLHRYEAMLEDNDSNGSGDSDSEESSEDGSQDSNDSSSKEESTTKATAAIEIGDSAPPNDTRHSTALLDCEEATGNPSQLLNVVECQQQTELGTAEANHTMQRKPLIEEMD